MNTTINLDWVKETKNTHVYKTDDIAAPVTQLYVQKAAFVTDNVPKVITVTITAES